MFKKILLSLLAILTVTTLIGHYQFDVHAETNEVLFEENFDGKTTSQLSANFRPATGNPTTTYSVVNDKLVINSTSSINPNAYYITKDVGSNYIFEADINMTSMIDSNRWAGFAFRVQDTNGFYKINLA